MRCLLIGLMVLAVLIAGCSSPSEPTEPKLHDGVIMGVDYHFDDWHDNPDHPELGYWHDLYVDVTIYHAYYCRVQLDRDGVVITYWMEGTGFDIDGEKTIFHFFHENTFYPDPSQYSGNGWEIWVASFNGGDALDSMHMFLAIPAH